MQRGRKKDSRKKHHVEKANFIKYDKRQIKQCLVCTIVFLIMMIVSFVVTYFDCADFFSDFLMVLLLLVYVCSGPAFFYSGYQLVAGICYMKRLQKHGYEIPVDKRDYGSLLERLPHREQSKEHSNGSRAQSKSSLVLGIFSACVSFVLVIWNIRYILEWSFMDGDFLVFVICLMSFADVVLLVYCILFFKQMNSDRYKDDVEIDSTRKNRIPVPDGVLTVLILLVISSFSKYTIDSMTDYMFKARISADIATVQQIRQSLSSAYESMGANENDASWELSRQDILNGVDITTWGVPGDDFQAEVAQSLGISDFTELKDEFHTSDGNAIVYVKIEKDTVTVEMMNPVDKVEGRICAQ